MVQVRQNSSCAIFSVNNQIFNYRVKVTPNSLVVNGGELLNEMSGGLFKATIHRVLDIGEPR